MRLPERITTARLRLILVTPEDAADMRAGRRQQRWHPSYPRRDDVGAAAMARADETWGPRHVVLDGQAVGSIGCFGAPDDPADPGVPAETEVGFGLVPEVRGRGIGTEALRGLLAETDAAAVRLRASVAPDNTAGLRLLARCGFAELRGSTGSGELVMARPLPAP